MLIGIDALFKKLLTFEFCRLFSLPRTNCLDTHHPIKNNWRLYRLAPDEIICVNVLPSSELTYLSISFSDDRVYIEVKAYNSYCMERMWIGPKDVKVDSLDESSLKEFKKYLFDHGLDRKAFTSLCRGSFPSRYAHYNICRKKNYLKCRPWKKTFKWYFLTRLENSILAYLNCAYLVCV